MKFVIGIDLGTSGLKALSVTAEGDVIHAVSVAYEPTQPHMGWSEQDVSEWMDALHNALIRLKILHGSVWPPQAIGFSGQMHGLICLDRAGLPLTSAMLWNDQRTFIESDEIMKITNGRIVEWTLNESRTAFTASKILWTKKHRPEVWKQTQKILLPKDYLRFLLSGTYATDVTDASGTNLLAVHKRAWSEEALEALDIPASMLPDLFESVDVAGFTGTAFSRAVGLPDGVPLVAGAADQAAAALGMGVVRPMDMSIMLGTSGVVYMQTATPLLDRSGALHTFCHSVPAAYQLMGGVLSAAGSAAWLHKLMNAVVEEAGIHCESISHDKLLAIAERAVPGSEGLLFLPYLTGERSPYNDPKARGSWFGLTSRHGIPELCRSVYEGVAFALKDLFVVAKQLGAQPEAIRLGGGGARGPLWTKIIASVFNLPIYIVESLDTSAFGAAILAGSSAFGMSLEKISSTWIKDKICIQPDEKMSRCYHALYEDFRSLYPASAHVMHSLHDGTIKRQHGYALD